MTAARCAFARVGPVHGVAAVAAALLPATASPAQTTERFSLSANAALGVASNPFLADGEDNQSSYVEFGIAPSLAITEERGNVTLQASLRATQYLRELGGSYSLSSRLAAERRLTESLSISAGATADSSVVGERRDSLGGFPLGLPLPGGAAGDLLDTSATPFEPLNSFDPIEPLDALDPDLGLLGERSRRNSLSADVAFAYRPHPEDQLRLRLGASRSSSPGRSAAVALRSVSANFSYSRILGVTSNVGISASVQQTRFAGGRGRSIVYQPQVTYSGQVSPIWNFSVGLGASFIRPDETGREPSGSTALSGDLRACRRGARLRLCLSGSRGAQESGRGSIGLSTQASVQLSYPLSERETVGLSGALARIEQSIDVLGILDENVRQQSLEADYQLRWRDRWEIGVTASYRDVYRIGRPIEPDFAATVSLRVGFER